MAINHETFEDVQADVYTRVQDSIEDEKDELREKIKAYYLEHNNTNYIMIGFESYLLDQFEDWKNDIENCIAETLSMYYSDAWNIVNLARFAWTEEDRQYYYDAVDEIEAYPTFKDFDDFMTVLCYRLVEALARDELNKQLEPFVSKVIESLETETHNA